MKCFEASKSKSSIYVKYFVILDMNCIMKANFVVNEFILLWLIQLRVLKGGADRDVKRIFVKSTLLCQSFADDEFIINHLIYEKNIGK